MIELVVGIMMLLTSGALLHDVPFVRFLPALILAIVGSAFFTIGMTGLQQ